jgi:CRISPR-associated endonuclease Csn1
LQRNQNNDFYKIDKVENISDDFLTREIEQKIWHIIYSVNDKIEYEKALKSFARKIIWMKFFL